MQQQLLRQPEMFTTESMMKMFSCCLINSTLDLLQLQLQLLLRATPTSFCDMGHDSDFINTNQSVSEGIRRSTCFSSCSSVPPGRKQWGRRQHTEIFSRSFWTDCWMYVLFTELHNPDNAVFIMRTMYANTVTESGLRRLQEPFYGDNCDKRTPTAAYTNQAGPDLQVLALSTTANQRDQPRWLQRALAHLVLYFASGKFTCRASKTAPSSRRCHRAVVDNAIKKNQQQPRRRQTTKRLQQRPSIHRGRDSSFNSSAIGYTIAGSTPAGPSTAATPSSASRHVLLLRRQQQLRPPAIRFDMTNDNGASKTLNRLQSSATARPPDDRAPGHRLPARDPRRRQRNSPRYRKRLAKVFALDQHRSKRSSLLPFTIAPALGRRLFFGINGSQNGRI